MTIPKMQIILTVVNILPMLVLVACAKYLYNDNYSQSHYSSQGSQWYQGQFEPQAVPIKNTAPNLEVVFDWKYLDFEYPNFNSRRIAIAERKFIPQNNLPLGVDFHKNRVFITTPRWKDGVPASLGYVDYPPSELSPAIKPYPNWDAHGDPYQPDCNKLISVYRVSIDDCNRMWVIDSGIVNATVSLNQICPPKIIAIDLNTDQIVISYEFPANQIKEDSLHSNIIADVHAGRCEDAYVYVTDVWRFGIVVYSLAKNRSWRITNYNFSPNPTASNFNVYGINFQWLDGVFGMSLSNIYDSKQNRLLYFHPMASFKEFVVSTELLRDENLWLNPPLDISQLFVEIGDRGENGQSSTSGIARNGVMFFTQVHRDNIGCWDTRKKYARSNLHHLLPEMKNSTTSLIQFPNDLKVDKEYNQGVWVVSNRLPIYLYSQLNFDEVNFRILRGDIDQIVSATVCDPLQRDQSIEDSVLVSLKEGQCY